MEFSGFIFNVQAFNIAAWWAALLVFESIILSGNSVVILTHLIGLRGLRDSFTFGAVFSRQLFDTSTNRYTQATYLYCIVVVPH